LLNFAVVGQGVTPATAREASRLCETFPRDGHETDAKNCTTRLGGIPAGSLEATWEVEFWEENDLGEFRFRRRWRCVVDESYRAEVFPGDVMDCFICFAGGNALALETRRNSPASSL
jgi:hypothetical protein